MTSTGWFWYWNWHIDSLKRVAGVFAKIARAQGVAAEISAGPQRVKLLFNPFLPGVDLKFILSSATTKAGTATPSFGGFSFGTSTAAVAPTTTTIASGTLGIGGLGKGRCCHACYAIFAFCTCASIFRVVT
jgi:hypothetical protein